MMQASREGSQEAGDELNFYDRWELAASTGRELDGLWIGTMWDDGEPLLRRVEEALALIRQHDARRYACLRRDLSRIWVRLLPGDRANFLAAARACQLDVRFVDDETVSIAELATTIVHEAAHARIDRCVPYREDLRARIEAACRREELAFARRLPQAGEVLEEARSWLESPPPDDTWSRAAFRQRREEGVDEMFRYLGHSERAIVFFRWLRRFFGRVRRVGRLISRLLPGHGSQER